jgi:DNA-binding NarL/FixJ family response regulator
MGAVAAATMRYTRAIRLAAAAAQLQRSVPRPFTSHTHFGRVRSWLNPIREALDPKTFGTAWFEGEALSLSDAIAYACSDDDASFSSMLSTSHSQKEQLPLTHRELEVAGFLTHGRTNKEIAIALVIAVSTVERHVANILNKLNLNSRTEVAMWAVQNGLDAASFDPAIALPARARMTRKRDGLDGWTAHHERHSHRHV